MKNFNLAIEKGKRYFEEETVSFYFIATEFIFNKKEIISGNYHIEFLNNRKKFFQQNLNIDVEERKVFVENSHEDPLIESENKFFICGQLTKDLINSEYEKIDCLFYFEKKLIRQQSLSSEQIKALFLLEKWNSKIINNEVTTEKNCTIRVHLGKKDSTYEEKEFQLKKNNSFNFLSYLEDYEYVAVQCSYEEGFDLEEKHVLKGFKGIWNSQYYFNKELYIPMVPFSKKYSKIKDEGLIDIISIEELLKYYNENIKELNKTFEMDYQFLKKYYLLYKTSAIGKLYSSKKSKTFHINTDLCQDCDKKSECLQLIPSGLSESLFKKNIMVENFKNCSINKLINKKDKYV